MWLAESQKSLKLLTPGMTGRRGREGWREEKEGREGDTHKIIPGLMSLIKVDAQKAKVATKTRAALLQTGK